MAVTGFDFSGWATKNDIKCADGRTINKDAFKQNHNTKVPLVWQHVHDRPDNVLGHALLENREEGVYAYCFLNETDSGKRAKLLVEHGDVNSMSIYANDLIEKGKMVHGGNIREVSLVLSRANPGAVIDNVVLQHGDEDPEPETGIIFHSGLNFSLAEAEEEIIEEKKDDKKKIVKHEDNTSDDGDTLADVIGSMTPKQREVMYAIVAKAANIDLADLQQGDNKGETFMKKNVFDKSGDDDKEIRHYLKPEQVKTIFADAAKLGSLKASFLAHAGEYGIDNIDYLFPDARSVTPTPTFIQRDMAWVSVWMNGTNHTPFSRIKSLSADITVETARALGYIKTHLKKEEFFALARRVTTPTTIYKKQKLDRDDIVDITDFDVVAWLKAEMRMMLDEEVARAGLIGDGRDVASEDKINETNIRPVYTDDEMYAFRVPVTAASTIIEQMEAIVRARKDYKGTKGNPTLFTTTDFLTDMLLVKDTLNRRLYNTVQDVAAALRVDKIVEVPLMEAQEYVDTTPTPDVTYDLLGIIVNPADYTYGADKGGAVSMFDDFDIDYNQYKYLIETRLSGALVNPKTAMIIEQAQA